MRSLLLARTAISLGAALTLAACGTIDSPRRSDSATSRCMSEPGRGSSVDANRPVFFLFCSESP